MESLNGLKIPENGWSQHYEVVRELGDCYASVGDYDSARKCYEQAASLDPDEAGPYIGLGVVEIQQGNLEQGRLSFKVALRLDPHNSKAVCGLAMVEQQNENYKDSFDLYLKSLELDVNNFTALLGLFQMSCQVGSFEKVIYYLQEYLERHPADTSVMFCLATLYHKDKKPERAQELLKDVLVFEPENEEAIDLLEEVEHVMAGQSV